MGELLQAHLPTSMVVKAFNNLCSETLRDLAPARMGQRTAPPS